MAPIGYRLPNTIFRYVFAVSWPHQIALVVLTVITFMLEVGPLEIQRRVVNDLVKERSFNSCWFCVPLTQVSFSFKDQPNSPSTSIEAGSQKVRYAICAGTCLPI